MVIEPCTSPELMGTRFICMMRYGEVPRKPKAFGVAGGQMLAQCWLTFGLASLQPDFHCCVVTASAWQIFYLLTDLPRFSQMSNSGSAQLSRGSDSQFIFKEDVPQATAARGRKHWWSACQRLTFGSAAVHYCMVLELCRSKWEENTLNPFFSGKPLTSLSLSHVWGCLVCL